MYAIEFETDITGNFIELKDYEQLLNKYAKVIVLVDEMNKETEQPITQTIKQLQQFNEILVSVATYPRLAMRLTVTFFDTNVLVYFAINQDVRQQSIAQILLQQAIEKQTLVISLLAIIEFIFVLSKLNQLVEQDKVLSFFQQFVKGQIVRI